MTRRPLAREYRPLRFVEVLGQQAPIRALSRAAASGSVAAAYIFSGTRGIGKTTIARIFAKALNCEKGPAEDCCADCTPCIEIAEGRSLDVLEMDAATHTGIDDIRELRDAARYPPGRERFRVFIVDEAHQLSQAAWNGLLKVLEEPPSWCVFMFCTTEPHKIPPTIESRALHFAFRSPSPEAIAGHLASVAEKEGMTLAGEALELLVRAADGSVRDGLSALDQVRAVGGDEIDAATVRDSLGLVSGEAVSSYLEALGEGDAAAGLGVVASLEDEGQDLRSFVAEVLARLREVAVRRATGGEVPPCWSETRPEMLAWLGRTLDQTELRLRQPGPSRVLLDLATVRMTAMSGLKPIEELASELAGDSRGGSSPQRPTRAPAKPVPRPARGGDDGAKRHSRRAASSSPPRRGPREAPPLAAAETPRETDGTAATSSPARDAAVSPSPPPIGDSRQSDAATGGSALELLEPLVTAVERIRPPLAAYLSRAESATLDESGTLRLVLPADKAVWKKKLQEGDGERIVIAAAQSVAGREPGRLEVLVSGEHSARRGVKNAEMRRASLDEARRDPLVRELFDRFGAIVVDASPLAESDDGPPGKKPSR